MIFPSISLHTSTSGVSRIARVTANISRPRACAHQLPRIASPAIAATSDGTGPVPDSSTNPCVDIKASASAGVKSDSATGGRWRAVFRGHKFTMNVYCLISTRKATEATLLARRLYSFCIPRVDGENSCYAPCNSQSSTRSESGGYVTTAGVIRLFDHPYHQAHYEFGVDQRRI